MASNKHIDVEKIREALSKTKILHKNIKDEMENSFISYAMAVNASRAIPDVRDGLKPVQRRILFSMNEASNYYNAPHKKCARIVGDVMGKYHPHGDSSIYEALARMAQPFSINHPLVDGQGNFGSIDGDKPAAMRYTEARLSKIAAELLKDIDKETVDFYPNYDDTLLQPVVLPARFPNLLVNGTEGIAVGMATNIPPHNLSEVVDGTVALIDNPDITIDELMQYIPAPDYPTGGLVLGRAAVREAYRTGHGGVVIRAKCEIEENNGRESIVVTEIPYQVIKEDMLKNIAQQVKDKRLDGISNIHEHSDRTGMRIVIDVKKDFSAQVVLNSLYKQTSLQVKEGIIFLALVNGAPKICNLKEMLEAYVAHQIDVIERRTRYNLQKAKEREHIVEGLVIAQNNIDEVIATIKASADTKEAMTKLMEKFGLSDKQAAAIVEMKLRALTGLEVEKLRAELEELRAAIADYNDILAKPERVRAIIKEDLIQIKEKYGVPRRSELSYDSSEINIADLIEREDVVVSMTYGGYIKRLPVDEYRVQNRGGIGVTAHKTKEEDFVSAIFTTNTHDGILFFSNFGRVYFLMAYEIPEATKTSKGRAIINILPLSEGEKITSLLNLPEYQEGYLVMATKKGLIKKTDMAEFKKIRANGKRCITLAEGDELVGVLKTDGNSEIMMASATGKCIRFAESAVRSTGRDSMGVKSMKIEEDDEIVDIALVDETKEVVTITENGYGKRCSLDEYRLQGRAGKGIKAGNFTEKTGRIVNQKLVNPTEDDLIIISNSGIMIRIKAEQIRKTGRATQGVIVMRQRGDAKVMAMALTPHDDEASYDEFDEEGNIVEKPVETVETQTNSEEQENK